MKKATLWRQVACACVLTLACGVSIAAVETLVNDTGDCSEAIGCSAPDGLSGNPNDLAECFSSASFTAPFDLTAFSYIIAAPPLDPLEPPAPDTLNLRVWAWTGVGAPGAIIDTRPLGPADLTAGPHAVAVVPPITIPTQFFCVGVNSDPLGDGFRIKKDAGADNVAGATWILAPTCGAAAFTELDGIGFPGNWCITATIEGTAVPTGACCASDTCAVRPEADCDAIGGVYLGDGTECFSDSGEVSDHVANPNLPISSALPPAVSQIVVNDSFIISDLDVDFIARHTWVGDLEVRIQGPDGTVVLLQDNICGNVDDENVIFDDEAGPLVCGSPVTGGAPANPLSVFDGTDALGVWTLTVTDTLAGDTGTLDQWSLHFDKAVANCTNVGACCTDAPGVASDCIETTAVDCEAGNGLFVGGPCANILDCVALFVQIDSMSATKTNRGVLIEWSTSVEQDTQGFRVLRETGTRDKALRIISPFIPAAGSNLVGASYEFLDSERTAGNSTYWIEEIDIYGRVKRHGPIHVTTTRVSSGR